MLAPALAKHLQMGALLEVVYPHGWPVRAIPVLAVRRAFSGVGWILCFALCVLILLCLRVLAWRANVRWPHSAL